MGEYNNDLFNTMPLTIHVLTCSRWMLVYCIRIYIYKLLISIARYRFKLWDQCTRCTNTY